MRSPSRSKTVRSLVVTGEAGAFRLRVAPT
jgi:hypothetical protein